jgi:hypothetical protein
LEYDLVERWCEKPEFLLHKLSFRLIMARLQLLRTLFVFVVFSQLIVVNEVMSAVVIDFDSIDSSSAPAPITPPPYAEDGFVLNLSTGDFRSLIAGDPNYTGSTAFYPNIPSSTVTLTSSLGTSFDFESIDLARLNISNLGGFTLRFFGFDGASQVADQSVTVLNVATVPTSNQLQEFTFSSDFDSVTSVTWSRTAGNTYQFDNINLNVTAVPEPTCFAFLVAAVSVAGVRRLRRTVVEA